MSDLVAINVLEFIRLHAPCDAVPDMCFESMGPDEVMVAQSCPRCGGRSVARLSIEQLRQLLAVLSDDERFIGALKAADTRLGCSKLISPSRKETLAFPPIRPGS